MVTAGTVHAMDPVLNKTKVERTSMLAVLLELGVALDRFEADFGVMSERLSEAFPAGTDCGNMDFQRWSELYVTWLAAGGPHGGRSPASNPQLPSALAPDEVVVGDQIVDDCAVRRQREPLIDPGLHVCIELVGGE